MASALTISTPPSRSARSRARSDLPVAVGPTSATGETITPADATHRCPERPLRAADGCPDRRIEYPPGGVTCLNAHHDRAGGVRRMADEQATGVAGADPGTVGTQGAEGGGTPLPGEE